MPLGRANGEVKLVSAARAAGVDIGDPGDGANANLGLTDECGLETL